MNYRVFSKDVTPLPIPIIAPQSAHPANACARITIDLNWFDIYVLFMNYINERVNIEMFPLKGLERLPLNSP